MKAHARRRGGATEGEILMDDRQKVLDEVFELALQNDMRYFG